MVCVTEIDVLLQKMAPSPENDNEPKAPDKSDSKKSATGANKLSSELLDLETSSSADQVSVILNLLYRFDCHYIPCQIATPCYKLLTLLAYLSFFIGCMVNSA